MHSNLFAVPPPRPANKLEGKWKGRTTKNHQNRHLSAVCFSSFPHYEANSCLWPNVLNFGLLALIFRQICGQDVLKRSPVEGEDVNRKRICLFRAVQQAGDFGLFFAEIRPRGILFGRPPPLPPTTPPDDKIGFSAPRVPANYNQRDRKSTFLVPAEFVKYELCIYLAQTSPKGRAEVQSVPRKRLIPKKRPGFRSRTRKSARTHIGGVPTALFATPPPSDASPLSRASCRNWALATSFEVHRHQGIKRPGASKDTEIYDRAKNANKNGGFPDLVTPPPQPASFFDELPPCEGGCRRKSCGPSFRILWRGSNIETVPKQRGGARNSVSCCSSFPGQSSPPHRMSAGEKTQFAKRGWCVSRQYSLGGKEHREASATRRGRDEPPARHSPPHRERSYGPLFRQTQKQGVKNRNCQERSGGAQQNAERGRPHNPLNLLNPLIPLNSINPRNPFNCSYRLNPPNPINPLKPLNPRNLLNPPSLPNPLGPLNPLNPPKSRNPLNQTTLHTPPNQLNPLNSTPSAQSSQSTPRRIRCMHSIHSMP